LVINVQKRKKQKTFRALLQEHASEYHSTEMDKREFIDEFIMSKFPNGAYMVLVNGDKVQLDADDTFKIISQKLRDQYNKSIKPKKQKEEAAAAASLSAEGGELLLSRTPGHSFGPTERKYSPYRLRFSLLYQRKETIVRRNSFGNSFKTSSKKTKTFSVLTENN